MSLRIGVDAACLANERGYGRFARELLAALLPIAPADFILFADDRSMQVAQTLTAKAGRGQIVTVQQNESPTLAAAASRRRTAADMFRFSTATYRERLDVFFSPSVYTYFPLPPGLPALVCIHDAIASRFPHLTLPSWRARFAWNLKTRLALKQASLVLTVSEFAARDIARCYGIPAGRIRVATEAPSASYTPSTDRVEIRRLASGAGVPEGSEWFIYVGGFNPHKHVDLLVRAHARVASERRKAPHLLLVGSTSSDVFHGARSEIVETIRECGTESLVHWAGFVGDADLRHLLSGAIALVLPSECEGFGLPAIEAAGCGTPVIATRESPLPELLPNAGFFVAPRDVDALTAAMRTLMDDPRVREQQSRAALAATAQLSWERAAQSTWQALQEIST